MVFRILKLLGMIVMGIVLVVLIAGGAFLWLSPQFGGSHAKSDIERYSVSRQFVSGQFTNLIPTSLEMSAGKMASVIRDQIAGDPRRKPAEKLKIEHVDSLEVIGKTDTTSLLWFGHSAFLLQIDGKRLLLDPMFGDSPSPIPFFVEKRYSGELPIEIEKIPEIDAILLSHDHYDHLDYGSIVKLKDKTAHFFVPLGVAAHLRSWGIDSAKITECDWWDEQDYMNLSIAFTPARHFSGRGLTDRNKTLWGSWVISGAKENLYFSGDSGYGPHFGEIGERYGPFDLSMMECGQYDERWSQLHMMPEETAQAAMDLKSHAFMPIHWGAFTLALHPWTDPAERVTNKAQELNLPVFTPKIGEWIYLGDLNAYSEKWWRDI